MRLENDESKVLMHQDQSQRNPHENTQVSQESLNPKTKRTLRIQPKYSSKYSQELYENTPPQSQICKQLPKNLSEELKRCFKLLQTLKKH